MYVHRIEGKKVDVCEPRAQCKAQNPRCTFPAGCPKWKVTRDSAEGKGRFLQREREVRPEMPGKFIYPFRHEASTLGFSGG